MPEKLHINTLFVLPQLARGGSETLVYNLARMMDRSKFNPSVSYLRHEGDRDFINEFERNNIKVYSAPKRSNFDFGLMRKLAGIIEKDNIKIINAHHFISMVYSFYACKRNKNVRLVYTEHSTWEIDCIPLKWRIIGSYLLNHLDAITTVTDEIALAIQKKFFLRGPRILTIKNGIDLNRFNLSHNKTFIRDSIGIEPDSIVIGMVANFRKIKNHMLLLKVFKYLLSQYSGLKLILVGQGFTDDPENSEEDIRGFVQNNDMNENVIFTGFRRDIPELLAIMDIFCLTSFNEGLPISLIEAMAAGLPVVGTNVAGIRDVIKSGFNGFLVDFFSFDKLQNALRALLDNKEMRVTFGNNSRVLATESFSLRFCVDRYQDLFQRLYYNLTDNA